MKKVLLVLSLLLLLGAAVFVAAAKRSLSFTAGYYVKAENGAHLLIAGSSPIQLSDQTNGSGHFTDLTSGDRIRVLHDGIAESYPARTGVYGLWKLDDGSIEDVPVSVLDSLMDMGWTFEGIEQPDPLFSVDPFPSAVSWANYSEDSLLWDRALNRDKIAESSAYHLPVLRFDSAAELAAFKADISGIFDTQYDYDEIPSFDTVTAEMDEDFFADNSLLLTYVWNGSCTPRYGVNRVDVEKDTLTVHVQRTDSYEVGDCAMAGWFITLTVPKDALEGITGFDAVLNSSPE